MSIDRLTTIGINPASSRNMLWGHDFVKIDWASPVRRLASQTEIIRCS
jgi:hypothetical protein